MKCPTCGAWTGVVDSRVRKTDGVRVRRYECANGHRFTTDERPRQADPAGERRSGQVEVIHL